MESPPFSGRKCRFCKELFIPAPRNKATQRFCSEADCRKASKAQSDRRWLRKNPDYHRGPHQVERVRQWRAQNVGYSRGPKRKKASRALQVFVPTQAIEQKALGDEAGLPPSAFSPGASAPIATPSGNAAALQDFVHQQDPLVVGLIATMLGGALQEGFVPFAQELVERGRRVLAQNRGGLGFQAAAPTST